MQNHEPKQIGKIPFSFNGMECEDKGKIASIEH
jgi:hypothetical protein